MNNISMEHWEETTRIWRSACPTFIIFHCWLKNMLIFARRFYKRYAFSGPDDRCSLIIDVLLFRVMGDVLNAWCERGTLNSRNAMKLCEALDQARLSHHAKVIKDISTSMSIGTLRFLVHSCKYYKVLCWPFRACLHTPTVQWDDCCVFQRILLSRRDPIKPREGLSHLAISTVFIIPFRLPEEKSLLH